MSKKNYWKQVAIDGKVFSGSVEGLVGIEICTDYNTNSLPCPKGNKSNENSKPKLKRRKLKDKFKDYHQKQVVNDTYSPSKCGNTLDAMEEKPFDVPSDPVRLNLPAWESFGLPEPILKALHDLKFTQPTQIQSLTLPGAIFGKRNILGSAETGSGKTLAFGLPILVGILKEKEKITTYDQTQQAESDSEESEFEMDLDEINETEIGCTKSVNIELRKEVNPLYALILTPTRELAMQIRNHLIAAAKYTGIKIAVVVGGMAAVKQERILSRGPEIVVATPGRLWELIELGNPHLSQINNIRYLAIDEIDRMLERGHFQELYDLLARINYDESKKKQRQNFVFSATLTLIHELPRHLKTKSKLLKSKEIHSMTPAEKINKIINVLDITDPKVVDINLGKGTSGTLTECKIICGIEEKDYYLYYFLKKHPGKTIIFCNSIGSVKRLSTLLSLLDCHPLPLHSLMQQRQRLKNIERFRDMENCVLVATDIAARGLDIPNVQHVLHYQTPRTTENYVHRSGRTARAMQKGITVLLTEPNELQNYLRLCRTLEKAKDLPTFPVEENYLKSVKQRVNLAREVDKLQLQIKKSNSEAGWFQKAAEDMDIILENRVTNNSKETEQIKKLAGLKRKQLESLLVTTICPRGLPATYSLFSEGMSSNMLLENGFKEENAIETMKNAIKDNMKPKKRNVHVYKKQTRIKNNETQPFNIGENNQ